MDGRTCDCVRRVMQQLRRKEIEELSSLSISSFDTMQLDYYPNTVDKALGESVRSYMARVLADLRDYAADFSPATRESLLLVGNAGLGKTHAALAIAGEVLRQNYDVIYVSCPDFFGKLEALHFGTDPGGEEETLFQIACNADLLILDDLGTEFNSSFFLTNLYSLLNNRLGAKLLPSSPPISRTVRCWKSCIRRRSPAVLQPLCRSSFWAVISGYRKPQNKSFYSCRSCTSLERNHCKINAQHCAKKKPSAAACRGSKPSESAVADGFIL